MNNELLFLKYLDSELSQKEVEQVDKLLLENMDQKEIFETVKKKKENTLVALEQLNPDQQFVIPAFKPESDQLHFTAKKPLILRTVFWRTAAVIIILLTTAFGLWFFNNQQQHTKTEIAFTETASTTTQPDHFGELNYYISPNRCWNNRELVWTVIQLE